MAIFVLSFFWYVLPKTYTATRITQSYQSTVILQALIASLKIIVNYLHALKSSLHSLLN